MLHKTIETAYFAPSHALRDAGFSGVTGDWFYPGGLPELWNWLVARKEEYLAARSGESDMAQATLQTFQAKLAEVEKLNPSVGALPIDRKDLSQLWNALGAIAVDLNTSDVEWAAKSSAALRSSALGANATFPSSIRQHFHWTPSPATLRHIADQALANGMLEEELGGPEQAQARHHCIHSKAHHLEGICARKAAAKCRAKSIPHQYPAADEHHPRIGRFTARAGIGM